MNMTITEAMQARHSVRQYTDQPLGADVVAALQKEIDVCNRESGLHIQLVTNEPEAFDCLMARYGKFRGVTDYLALVGKKGADLEELCGYYGERLVLLAQRLGLNTCWVALTYRKVKTAFAVGNGEKLGIVIALGYGATQGTAHKSKKPEEVFTAQEPVPDWFRRGVDAALLAPTALNQQKFRFSLQGDRVSLTAGRGAHTKLDRGIVKYHFELGAGDHPFVWD